MSIIWVDSLQAYNGINTNSYSLQGSYTVARPGSLSFASTGRVAGSRSLVFDYSNSANSIYKAIPASNTVTAGFSFYVTSPVGGSYPRTILTLMDAALSVNPCRLEIVGSSTLQFTTPAGTTVSSYAVPTGTWLFIEVVFTGGTSGSASCYINGGLVFTATGNFTTTLVSNVIFGSYYFGGNSEYGSVSFSDLYVANDAASRGDCRIQVQVPAANSSVAWTPLSGSNYANVNELPVDGDSSYVYTSTSGNQDLYTVNALSGTPTSIKAVQVRTCMRKVDASAHTAASVMSSSGTVSVGTTQNLGTSYSFGTDVYLTDPHTSAAWTGAAVNALLIGQKLVS